MKTNCSAESGDEGGVTLVRGDFFSEKKLLLQSDVVFDSESNGRKHSTWWREKNYFQFFFSK